MLKKYIEYLKNNPQEYWFKRKMYGWGWTPVKWQGWATVLVFVVLLVWIATGFASSVASTAARAATVSVGASDMLFWFFAKIVALSAVLIFICYKKGEPLAWQWGEREMGPTRKTCDGFFVSEAKQKTEQVYRSCKESQMKKREKSDWRNYQSTPTMRKIQLVLLVMIIIGLLLLATQKLWVGSVVDFILKNFH